jgi:hypothetical protein
MDAQVLPPPAASAGPKIWCPEGEGHWRWWEPAGSAKLMVPRQCSSPCSVGWACCGRCKNGSKAMCPAVESRSHGLGPALGARPRRKSGPCRRLAIIGMSIRPHSGIFSPVATAGDKLKTVVIDGGIGNASLGRSWQYVVVVLNSGIRNLTHPRYNYPRYCTLDIPIASHALNQGLGIALQIKAARHNKQNSFRQFLNGRRGAKLAPEPPHRALAWEETTRHHLRLRSSSTHLGFHNNQPWSILSPIRNRQTRQETADQMAPPPLPAQQRCIVKSFKFYKVWQTSLGVPFHETAGLTHPKSHAGSLDPN